MAHFGLAAWMQTLASPRSAPVWCWSLAVGASVALLCGYLARPTPGAGDQAELALVAWSWGVAHPTGYPLWSLLAHLWVKLWAGADPAEAVARLSALYAGVAAGVTVHVGVALGSRRAGVVAALLFGLSPVAWQQATQVEVYPLFWVFQALEVLALQRALTAGDDRGARRGLYGAALIGGLGGTHHLLIGLLVPAALLVVWCRRATLRGRDAAGLLGLTLAPLSLYALTPWRASQDPAVSWHRVTGLGQLLVHSSGSLYESYFRLDHGVPRQALSLAFGGAVPLTVLVALAALGAARLQPRSSAMVPGAYLLTALAFGWNYLVVDQQVFLLPAVWAVCLLAALGIEVLARLVAMPLLGSALALALPIVELSNVVRLEPTLASHDEDLAILQAAPHDAIAYLTGPSGFTLFYPLLARGLRPDLEPVDGNLEVRARYDLGPAFLSDGIPEGADPAVAVLQALLATGRPIVSNPAAPAPAVDAAHGLRLRAGVIDLILPEGPPGPGAATCGEVRFNDAVLGLPCPTGGAVAPLGVLSAPLTWTASDPGALEIILLDAADDEPIHGGQARKVLETPMGMGRPASLLPRDAPWRDALWIAVPRGTPSGSRAIWIGLRRGGVWQSVEQAGATPAQGPFARLLHYSVEGGAPPGLWTLPG